MRAMKDFQPGRDTGSAGSAPADIDFEAEHRPEVSRRASNAALRRYVQKQAVSGASLEATHDAAAKGVASPTTSLPFADQIQSSFGPSHDVSKINAHVGGDSASAMGANAYASGNHVVFDRSPDLHTAAHEAAHVVQQAQGVNLYGGVGEAGDSYERHADAVADRVVAGQSAADLLGSSSGFAGYGLVQKKSVEEAKQNAYYQSSPAYIAAIERSTKRVWIATSVIKDWKAAPITEKGIGDHKAAFQHQYAIVEAEIGQLSSEISAETAANELHRKEIQDAMVQLDNAAFWFIDEYKAAVRFTAAHNDPIAEPNYERTKQGLRDIHVRVGTPYTEGGQAEKDPKPVDVKTAAKPPHVKAAPGQDQIELQELANNSSVLDPLTESAFYNNLQALAENAIYLTTMLTSKAENDDEIVKSFARAKGHGMEAHRLLPSVSPTTRTHHRDEVSEGIHGIEEMKKYLSEKSSLRESAPKLGEQLDAIKSFLTKK